MRWRGLFKGSDWRWISAALALLLACLGWTILSRHFIYGQGHSQRPILSFLLLYAVAWLAPLVGWRLLSKERNNSVVFAIVIALAARLLLIPSDLIQENDVYRYVLDGNVVLLGENPYQYSPLVVGDLGSADLKSELQRSEAQQVLSRIGYPEIPTVYPPAAQLAFASGALLSGWNWMGQRWIILAADLLVLFTLLQLLKSLAVPPAWVLLYAWNPLVLKEVVNSVHVDIFVALLTLLLIFQLLQYRHNESKFSIILAGATLGMASLTKLYPVLLLPSCIFFVWRSHRSARDLLYFSLSTVLIVTGGYLPFWSVGWERLTAGWEVYSRDWQMNEGAFALFAHFSTHARTVVAIVLAGISMLVPWLRRSGSVVSLVADFQWILLFWFLLLPAPFPWYAVPMVALACLRPRSIASLLTVILSGVVALYYLSFFYEYHEYARAWWIATRAVEHFILWFSLAFAGLRHAQLLNLFRRRKADESFNKSFGFTDRGSLFHVFSCGPEGRERSG